MFLIGILFYCFLLDSGNFYIFTTFLIFYYFLCIVSFILEKYLSYKYFLIFTLLLFLILFFVGKNIFIDIGGFVNKAKVDDLFSDVNSLNLNNISVLELFYRVSYFVVTFLTLFFADFTFSYVSVFLILIFLI